MVIDVVLLFVLFGVLGTAADYAVRNIKYIVSELNIQLFAFGILLGFVTSLPELSVGINSTLDGAASLSVGNLLGSVMVLFGLILGASLLLNREVTTNGKMRVLLPQLGLILVPVALGFDGAYGWIDGSIMIISYFGLIYYLYLSNHSFASPHLEIINKNKIARSFLFAITGVVFVLLASHWIVKITLDLLEYFEVSRLVIGVVVFAIGTNLPEITIALTSWRKKASELSLSHLLSSAFTNALILGVLAVISPINFALRPVFWVLSGFTILILGLFLVFYLSGRKMEAREGFFLLMTYLVFLMFTIYFV